MQSADNIGGCSRCCDAYHGVVLVDVKLFQLFPSALGVVLSVLNGALAVEKALPQMEDLVTRIVPRMKKGGRVFYMGAGTSGRLGLLVIFDQSLHRSLDDASEGHALSLESLFELRTEIVGD